MNRRVTYSSHSTLVLWALGRQKHKEIEVASAIYVHPTTRLSVHLFVGSSERGWRWRNRTEERARLGGCSRLVEGPMIEAQRKPQQDGATSAAPLSGQPARDPAGLLRSPRPSPPPAELTRRAMSRQLGKRVI